MHWSFVQIWGPENMADECCVTLGTMDLVSVLSRWRESKHRDAWGLGPWHPSAVLWVVARVWKEENMIPTPIFIQPPCCYFPALLHLGEAQGWFLDVFGVAWSSFSEVETVSLNYTVHWTRQASSAPACTHMQTHTRTPSSHRLHPSLPRWTFRFLRTCRELGKLFSSTTSKLSSTSELLMQMEITLGL